MQKYNSIRNEMKDLAITIFSHGGTTSVYAVKVEGKLNEINNKWKALCDRLGMTYKDAEETLFLLKILQEMLTRLNKWLNFVHENIKRVELDSCCLDEMMQYIKNIEVRLLYFDHQFVVKLKKKNLKN